MDPPKKENRPVFVIGARDVARTASFYRALGVPLVPHRPGVRCQYVGKLAGTEVHVVPSPEPRFLPGVFFGTNVPSIRIVVERLCADRFIPLVDAMDVRRTEEGRHALLKDPDGRLVLLVEGKYFPPSTLH